MYVLTMSTARRLVTTCQTERQEALALVLNSVQWTVTSVGIVPEPSGNVKYPGSFGISKNIALVRVYTKQFNKRKFSDSVKAYLRICLPEWYQI